MSVIDYTKMRKGKIVRQWEYIDKSTGLTAIGNSRVQVCPKCGRKGAFISHSNKDGSTLEMYTHKSHVVSAAGIQMNHVDDHCSIKVPAASVPERE